MQIYMILRIVHQSFLESYKSLQLHLQILHSLSAHILHLPPSNLSSSALLHQILQILLQLSRQDLPSYLPPLRLANLLPHGLHTHVLLLERFPHFDQVGGESLLLRLHILADVSFGFLEGLLDQAKDLLAESLELLIEDLRHVAAELIYAEVDVRHLSIQLQRKRLQALRGLHPRRLERGSIIHQSSHEFVPPLHCRKVKLFLRVLGLRQMVLELTKATASLECGLELLLEMVGSLIQLKMPFGVSVVEFERRLIEVLPIGDLADDRIAGLAPGALTCVSHRGLLEKSLLLEEAEQAAVFAVHHFIQFYWILLKFLRVINYLYFCLIKPRWFLRWIIIVSFMSNEELQIQLSKNGYSLQALQKKLSQKDPERQVTYLKLHLNYNPSILKEISDLHPCFPHLLILNLGFNNISSLEPLQKFNFQHLQELHLFHNCITSLRALRKCSMPSLQMISLVNNNIRELTGLSEWNCPKLSQLFAYNNKLDYAVASVIKMNCIELEHILMNEEALEKQQFAQYCYYFRFEHYTIS